MKKQAKKLVLSKETLRYLEAEHTSRALGAVSFQSQCDACGPSVTDCTDCPTNPFICQPVPTRNVWNPGSVQCQYCV